jgi:hypothetical protein
MGQSHVKRRRRERPLRRHRRAVARELQCECDQLGLDPSPQQRRELVEEVVWLASPWAFRGIDAVLPADRGDLIRAWLALRLVGAVETRTEIERMARGLAPAPDDDFRPGLRHWGDPTSDNVASAHASRHRRRARRGEGRPTSS